jgi:hypothetical protein
MNAAYDLKILMFKMEGSMSTTIVPIRFFLVIVQEIRFYRSGAKILADLNQNIFC